MFVNTNSYDTHCLHTLEVSTTHSTFSRSGGSSRTSCLMASSRKVTVKVMLRPFITTALTAQKTPFHCSSATVSTETYLFAEMLLSNGYCLFRSVCLAVGLYTTI
jgi:hypothetical protein